MVLQFRTIICLCLAAASLLGANDTALAQSLAPGGAGATGPTAGWVDFGEDSLQDRANDHLPSCDPDFRPRSATLFNDPSGSRSAQFRLLDHMVDLINCVPPENPDGSRASIKISFYSLTYAPVRRALVKAARRGVAVQAVTNSHADMFKAWRDLVRELGSDTSAHSFAVTCWQGCLTPRTPPIPGGPTAWFTARTASPDSPTAVFTDFSKAGAAPIVSWSWDFGDGTYATGRGPHRKTYLPDALYATSLTVRDALGQTHRVIGNVTIPDLLEPLYPSLHAKLLLLSTIGTGRAAQRWVSAYGSGNPTYYQASWGFNNLNVSVGDRKLYQAFGQYFADLVSGSRGSLLTPDYNRTTSTAGRGATGSPPTVIHFLPRASGDPQLDILRSITCRYSDAGRTRRTKIRISMFTITRTEIGAELWRMAYERGCSVDLVYSTMSQRLKAADGTWIRDETGAVLPWGPADCLAIPPTRVVTLNPGPRARRFEIPNTIDRPELCGRSPLEGRVAGATPGVWVDRVSPFTKGRLTVRAACPVVAEFDKILRVWAFWCRDESLLTHQKVMLVDGMVHGNVQKYVMTGSANWSESGLRYNDEVFTELYDAPEIHDAYLKAHKHIKAVLARTPTTGGAGQ